MYRVELYAEVRRSVYVEGLSERAAARRFGLARERRGTGDARAAVRDRQDPRVDAPSASSTTSMVLFA